jgi:IclR family KDG regulon transcriptional repressor
MSEIQSLARGLKILDLLGQNQDGVSITKLAEITRRFHLGSQVVSLSRSVLTRLPLREAAKPFLRQLMERTGECAHLAVPAQGKVLYIDQVESPATLRVNAQVGTMNPVHCTALGKALLAFGELEMPTDLERHTARTIRSRRSLLTHLEEIRKLGYAVDDEEFDLGVRCIAVPVFDYRGKVVGSIGISGPSSRVTSEKLPTLAGIVLEIGKALSERLTFSRQG